MDFDLIDEKERHYNDLSHGEQMIFGQLLNLYFYILRKNSNVFLFDEPEIALHPEWQRKYMNEILGLLKNTLKNNHFIFTSHSPFLLSDLPKENVIFLEKYDEKNKKELEKKYPKLKINGLENGNCINITEHIELKTFGANIHSLLSDGFFMSEGLMGEFAKSRINEIKKFYEIVKFLEPKNKKYKRILKILYLFKIKKFNHIQSIIGEPFLKTIMKNYLDELEQIFDNKTYKKNKMREFLDQFEPEELQKYLDEKNAKA